jgi:hypothetical protein
LQAIFYIHEKLLPEPAIRLLLNFAGAAGVLSAGQGQEKRTWSPGHRKVFRARAMHAAAACFVLGKLGEISGRKNRGAVNPWHVAFYST